ncbi:hypothetical protein HYC85_017625 [Camellia sinensis]|uniref:Uncharacterized protein n=1 Tax=Camellia sinensis TaxID=4442 RepID=A0A7J7GVU8_CAMSI|nr:hypothetical protein HYC85_017625 [Camellia sinensis]
MPFPSVSPLARLSYPWPHHAHPSPSPSYDSQSISFPPSSPPWACPTHDLSPPY